MTTLKRLALVLESQHEGPQRHELRDMILRMAASNADRGQDATQYPRETMMGMIQAWQAMVNERLAEMTRPETTTISGAEAEVLWFKATREGYAEAAKRDDPFTDDCLSSWPDWLEYKADIPKMLLRDMAWIVGYKDGQAFKAMQRWFAAHQGEGRDKDTVIHTAIKPCL